MDKQQIISKNNDANIEKFSFAQLGIFLFLKSRLLSKYMRKEGIIFYNLDNNNIQKPNVQKNWLQCNSQPLEKQQQVLEENDKEVVQAKSKCFDNVGMHSSDLQNNSQNDKKKCDIFSDMIESLNSKHHLEQCQMDHQPQRICKFCDEILYTDELYQQHSQQCKQKPFYCPTCHFTLYFNEKEKGQHIISCQMEVCEYCGKYQYLFSIAEHKLICYKNFIKVIKTEQELEKEDEINFAREVYREKTIKIQTTLIQNFEIEKMIDNVELYKKEQLQIQQNKQEQMEEEDIQKYQEQITQQYEEEF